MFKWIIKIFNFFFHRKEKIKRLEHYFVNYNPDGCHCVDCIGHCICKFCGKEVLDLIICEDKIRFIMNATYKNYIIFSDRFNDKNIYKKICKKCSPCLTHDEFIIKNIIE